MAQILISVPNLKEIATVTVALALWNHIDMPYAVWRRQRDYDEWLYFRSEVPLLANDLLLPKKVTDLVKLYASKILTEIDTWVTYHHRMTFFKQGPGCELYCLIGDLVWYPNGTIDYRKTALSLQWSLRLSELHKFRLLSVFCLVKEIERLWPRLFKNNAIDCIEFAEYPLIFYWKCYCRNELSKIPMVAGLTIDSTMFRNRNVDNWPAKEYFFDRMSAEDQVLNAIWIIDEHGVLFQKIILMKLTYSQRTIVLIDRASQIMANYCSSSSLSYSDDILKTWFELRLLIDEDQFVSIIGALITHSVDDYIVTEIWTTASDKFKLRVLNLDTEDDANEIWTCWIQTYNYDSFVMLINVSASIRAEIRKKKIFYDHCVDLLQTEKLSMLERILNLCFPKDRELAAFKLTLTQNDSFDVLCKRLIVEKDLSKLEKVLTFYFCDADDLVRFVDHLNAGEYYGFFTKRCYYLTLNDTIPTLEKMLNLCFRTSETLDKFKKFFVANNTYFHACCVHLVVKKRFPVLLQVLDLFFNQTKRLEGFKQDFVKDDRFIKHCKNLIIDDDLSMLKTLLDYFFVNIEELTRFKQLLVKDEFFTNHCQKLITGDKLPKLEALSNLIFFGAEELTSFKQSLTEKDFFKNHCYELTTLGELSKLNWLINWSFPDNNELAQFKNELIASKYVASRYGRYFATANLKRLNDLLKLLLSPRNDLIIEFKQKFLFSEDGFKACIALCNWPEDILNKTIDDCLPAATCDSTMQIKKQIIFSPATISKLKRMVRRDRVVDVKNCVEKFLTNDEDRKKIKMLIFDNVDGLIDHVFFHRKNDESGLSWKSWYLQDDQSLRECKYRISVGKIFQNALKDCVFETFDEHGRFSRCSLKKDFEFCALDVFLEWYFESPKEVKEYKIQMIDRYQDLAAINALLNKGCHPSYWKKLTNWFFENDAVEIAKFKKKHKREKIAKFVKHFRESYFQKTAV